MSTTPPSVTFFLQLAKTQAMLSNRFDRSLGGIGFTEFLILLHLDQAPGGQLSRIELAENVGLTASGVTRLLLPMAKVGLIKNGPASPDARVRPVMASKSGQQKMVDELKRLQFMTDELLSSCKKQDIENMMAVLRDIGGRVAMK